jgi:hypothetical protein
MVRYSTRPSRSATAPTVRLGRCAGSSAAPSGRPARACSDSLFGGANSVIGRENYPVRLAREFGRKCLHFKNDRPPPGTEAAAISKDTLLSTLFYWPYATTRKSSGEMTRKLSVIRSRKNFQCFGIVDLRNFRIARLKSRKVG